MVVGSECRVVLEQLSIREIVDLLDELKPHEVQPGEAISCDPGLVSHESDDSINLFPDFRSHDLFFGLASVAGAGSVLL